MTIRRWMFNPFIRIAGIRSLAIGLVVGALVILAGIIWMVALMWKAFSISCNIKGGRAIALFIVAVLIGEVVSKLLAVQFGYIGS